VPGYPVDSELPREAVVLGFDFDSGARLVAITVLFRRAIGLDLESYANSPW
jgi:hypothetical protein